METDNKDRLIEVITKQRASLIMGKMLKMPPYRGYLIELPNGQAISQTPQREFRLHTPKDFYRQK
jgi:hypothetical protein